MLVTTPPKSRCRPSRRPAPPTRLQAGQTPSAEHRSRPPHARSGAGARGCRSHHRPPAGSWCSTGWVMCLSLPKRSSSSVEAHPRGRGRLPPSHARTPMVVRVGSPLPGSRGTDGSRRSARGLARPLPQWWWAQPRRTRRRRRVCAGRGRRPGTSLAGRCGVAHRCGHRAGGHRHRPVRRRPTRVPLRRPTRSIERRIGRGRVETLKWFGGHIAKP